jgi:hypothetical protein
MVIAQANAAKDGKSFLIFSMQLRLVRSLSIFSRVEMMQLPANIMPIVQFTYLCTEKTGFGAVSAKSDAKIGQIHESA